MRDVIDHSGYQGWTSFIYTPAISDDDSVRLQAGRARRAIGLPVHLHSRLAMVSGLTVLETSRSAAGSGRSAPAPTVRNGEWPVEMMRKWRLKSSLRSRGVCGKNTCACIPYLRFRDPFGLTPKHMRIMAHFETTSNPVQRGITWNVAQLLSLLSMH